MDGVAAAAGGSTAGGRPVLTIVQILAEKARALREKPLPENCCPYCYRHHGRGLYINHCVCTGHIDLSRKDIFSQTPKTT